MTGREIVRTIENDAARCDQRIEILVLQALLEGNDLHFGVDFRERLASVPSRGSSCVEGVRFDQFFAGAADALCAVASGIPFRNLSACWNWKSFSEANSSGAAGGFSSASVAGFALVRCAFSD